MTPFRVLFVCTANICRSSTAELMARAAVPGDTDLVFESAGTHGYTDAAVETVMAAALPAGLDLTAFRSRPLTTEMLTSADVVLTMEAAHRDFILRDHPSLFRKVLTLGQFAAAVGNAPPGLDRAALIAHVGVSRGPADPALDVADPYGRGPEAASGCVARLDELLQTVLPALSADVPGKGRTWTT